MFDPVFFFPSWTKGRKFFSRLLLVVSSSHSFLLHVVVSTSLSFNQLVKSWAFLSRVHGPIYSLIQGDKGATGPARPAALTCVVSPWLFMEPAWIPWKQRWKSGVFHTDERAVFKLSVSEGWSEQKSTLWFLRRFHASGLWSSSHLIGPFRQDETSCPDFLLLAVCTRRTLLHLQLLIIL